MADLQRTETYAVRGDCRLQADVFVPAAGGPRPVVVWLHGGALIMGHRRSLGAAQRDRYLNAGYAVVAIDYRLAPETQLPGIIEDLRDAFRWVRESGPGLFQADPERTAAVGHSAGGYLALMAGCCVEPPLSALVSFYGYGDIAADWYSRPDPGYCQQPLVPEADARRAVGQGCLTDSTDHPDRHRFYLYCRQQGRWPNEVAGHYPHAEPRALDPFCPLRNVTPAYPPTLLLHGDQDADVPYQQSALMAEALARAGVEHELITIPGGDHGFDAGDHPLVPEALRRVDEFLSRHLG
jgi:acetyl esterase/lipase